MKATAQQILALLPHTQCQRCSYADCAAYADAIASGAAGIDQCPPGGSEGVKRLAALTDLAEPILGFVVNPQFGREQERTVAYIDENWCIGCTLCIKACPVDAIVGSNKTMHSIIESVCTGCELCIPACPVDCIEIEIATPGQTGWNAWTNEQALKADSRYAFHSKLINRYAGEQDKKHITSLESKLADLSAHSTITDAAQLDKKRSVVQAALQKAREKKAGKA